MRAIGFLCLAACGGHLDTSAQRTTVNIRVVNLFSAGQGSPGPAVDVYRAQSPQQGAAREATPVASALGYGTASSLFHPLQNAADLRFFDSGTTSASGSFAGFSQDVSTFQDGDLVTIVITGDTSGSGGALVPAWETRYENRSNDTPQPDASHALLYIDDAWRSPYAAQDSGFYLGSGGTCLTSTTSTGGPNLIVSGEKTYAFSPGSFSVGLFVNPPSGIPDCSGTPASGPATVSNVAAGSRTWLLLYGTSWVDKRLLPLAFVN